MYKNRSFFFVNLFLLAVFLLWNFLQPFVFDDYYVYSQTLYQFVHYYIAAGNFRLVADILAVGFFNSKFGNITIPLLNILNSIFLVFFYVISFNLLTTKAKKSDKHNLKNINIYHYLIYIAIFTMFLVASGFMRNIMWKTVAIQYFWPILLMLFIYSKQYSIFTGWTQYKQNTWLYIVYAIFVGILSNEIFFMTLCFIYVLAYIYCRLVDSRYQVMFDRNIHVLMLSNIILGIIMLIAHLLHPSISALCASPDTLSHHFILQMFVKKIAIWIVVVILLLTHLSHLKKENELIKVGFIILLVIGLFGMFIPLMDVYSLMSRMTMLASLILFVMTCQSVDLPIVLERLVVKPFFRTSLITISIVIFMLISIMYLLVHHEYQTRAQQIKFAHQQGITNPAFPPLMIPGIIHGFILIGDITADPNTRINQSYAKMYDFQSVRLK